MNLNAIIIYIKTAKKKHALCNVPTNGEFNKIHIYGHEIIRAPVPFILIGNGFISFYGGE